MSIPLPLNLTELVDNLVIPSNDEIDQAQRVFHGRGHAYNNLNHITIDWLKPLLLITLFAPLSKTDLASLAKKLKSRFGQCTSIQVQYRYKPDWLVDCIFGNPIHQLEILENNRRYKVEIKTGANTGLFLDMKNGRDWVQSHSLNKRVLNLFAYTCAFSIAAVKGEAKSVYNIDMKSSFLNIGRENHRINHHNMGTIRFEKLNILKSFGRIKKHAPYDLIICDPPTFQKGSFNIVRDYPKLIRRMKELITDEGTLFLCTNAPNVGSLTGREFIFNTVEKEAKEFELFDEISPSKVFADSQNKGTRILMYKRKIT